MTQRNQRSPRHNRRIKLRSEPFPNRLRWGVRNGIGISLVYVGFAALQFLFNMNLRATYGDTLVPIVGVYLIGGCLGGALVGLLLPFIRSRTVCGIIGFLVILPTAILTHYVWLTNADWGPSRIATVVFGSLLIGAPLGVSVGEQYVGEVNDSNADA
jgi:hypothetical protein